MIVVYFSKELPFTMGQTFYEFLNVIGLIAEWKRILPIRNHESRLLCSDEMEVIFNHSGPELILNCSYRSNKPY